MKHSDAVRRQVCELLRKGHPPVEVARTTGLPIRTVRDIAEQEDIVPANAGGLPTQVMGEGLLGELVAIVSGARLLLDDLAEKIKRGNPNDAPKYAAAYAKVLDSVTKLGVAQPVRNIDSQVEIEEGLEIVSGGALLDMNIVRGNDDAAGDPDFEDGVDAPVPPNIAQRERLLRTHMERALQSDPQRRVDRMMAAFGGVPPMSPRDLRHERLVGDSSLEESVMAAVGVEEPQHGVLDP